MDKLNEVYKQVVIREVVMAALFDEIERRFGVPFELVVDQEAFDAGVKHVIDNQPDLTTMTFDPDNSTYTIKRNV